MEESLYPGLNIKQWSISNLVKVLEREWSYLNPSVEKKKSYGKNSGTQIVFRDGEITVAVEIVREPHAPDSEIHLAYILSLSPIPFDFSNRALSTFDFNYFIGSLNKYADIRVFCIGKNDRWEGSILAEVTKICALLIESMKNYESCLSLLIDDTFSLKNLEFDTRPESLTQLLTKIKAYALASTYRQTESRDVIVDSIMKSAYADQSSRNRVIELRKKGVLKGGEWLYSQQLIEDLRARDV